MRRRGRPGLIGTMARTAVIAGTATAVSGTVQQNQAQQAAGQQQAATPPAPARLTMAEKMSQIRELGELRTGGMLTDAEFDAAKAQILAG